jgi:hypothetical protein
MGDNEEYQEITEGWSGIKERKGGRKRDLGGGKGEGL